MLTGELRNKVDRLWDTFWTGGISNPLEVIEQITYLLFIKRLDDLQTLEESKANALRQPLARRIFSEGKDEKGVPFEDYRWSRLKNKAPSDMFGIIADHVAPHSGRPRLTLCEASGWSPFHHPDTSSSWPRCGYDRSDPDGGSRHQGRSLRISPRKDRHRRSEWPIPHSAPHHPAHGRDYRAESK